MSDVDAGARVASLFRYPVKSMLGETIARSDVGERGLLGDRTFAVVDEETGKVASAKHPRRWGRLLECRAEFVDEPAAGAELPPVRITLPDGATLQSTDADANDRLSQFFDRRVRLDSDAPARPMMEQYRPAVEGFPDASDETVVDEGMALVAPNTYFDAAPLHVVTSATLERLGELEPDSVFTARRFRPNVVVEVAGASGFPENDWVGHVLAFGDVRASVFLSAPRCVMTTLPQGDLPRDAGVLRAIARHNRFEIPGLGPSSCVGVYALVDAGGSASVGQAVELL
jgi:MOSC domain-containing protein